MHCTDKEPAPIRRRIWRRARARRISAGTKHPHCSRRCTSRRRVPPRHPAPWRTIQDRSHRCRGCGCHRNCRTGRRGFGHSSCCWCRRPDRRVHRCSRNLHNGRDIPRDRFRRRACRRTGGQCNRLAACHNLRDTPRSCRHRRWHCRHRCRTGKGLPRTARRSLSTTSRDSRWPGNRS